MNNKFFVSTNNTFVAYTMKICRLNASDLFEEWLLHKLIGFHNCNVSAISLEKCMAFGVSGNGTPYWSRKEKKNIFTIRTLCVSTIFWMLFYLENFEKYTFRAHAHAQNRLLPHGLKMSPVQYCKNKQALSSMVNAMDIK